MWNPAPGCKAPGIPPWPKPPKDGKFQLWWPSSVSYTDSNDDDGNLNTPYSSPEVIVGGSYQTQARALPADGPGVEEATLATTSPQAEAEAAPAPRCPPSQIVYAPLSKNNAKEIRLLRLLKGSLDDPIHGELAIAPLQDQVGLMTEVYSSAQQVFVYLGEDQFELASTLTRIRWPWERLSITPAAAQRFFNLPYFSRVWVVQEVANAKSVTVHYGSRSVDWAALQLVPSFATHVPGWIKAGCNKSKPSWQDFAQLLLDTSTLTHASDPRDSVFALFGLAKDCGSQGLVADYTLTLPDVYIGAAAFAILNLGDKRVLRHAAGHNTHGIPTWVPIWGKFRRRSPNESLRIPAKKPLLPDVTTAHPTNCGCAMWGNVSISRSLGAIKIFATTILNLGDFNLYWVPTRNGIQIFRTWPPPILSDYTLVASVNDAEPRPTGRLILLHGSDALFSCHRRRIPRRKHSSHRVLRHIYMAPLATLVVLGGGGDLGAPWLTWKCHPSFGVCPRTADVDQAHEDA